VIAGKCCAAPETVVAAKQVVSKDGDPQQIALIRDHLRKEAAAFARSGRSFDGKVAGNERSFRE
jgi:hypothetical protein